MTQEEKQKLILFKKQRQELIPLHLDVSTARIILIIDLLTAIYEKLIDSEAKK